MGKNAGETVETLTILAREDQDRDFTKVYKMFASKVLEDLGTMNVEAKILLWMLSQRALMPMQASGFIDCPQEMLGYALGCKRLAVNRAMNRLKERGYIEQRRAKSHTWRIMPDLCFRGSLTNYWKNVAPIGPLDGVDVYCPWSQADYAKMKRGEQPIPGLEETPVPKAM